MARPTPWEYLKSEVLTAFENGMSLKEAWRHDVYKQIPRNTVRGWYEAWYGQFRRDSDPVSTDGENKAQPAIAVIYPQTENKVVSLTSVEGSESDFSLARKTVREIAKDRKQPGAVRVQAANSLIRLIELRYNLPKSVLEEQEEQTVDTEREQLRELPPEEIARRYREALG